MKFSALTRPAMLGLAVSISGCSLVVPYDDEFMCSANPDYGKCTDVAGAYSEALGGTIDKDAAKKMGDDKKKKKDKDKEKDKDHHDEGEGELKDNRSALVQARDRYRAAEYSELAKNIEAPVTPMVRPATVLRTLVVAYSSSQSTLYMPRYIFFFADPGEFILGDYLANKSPNAGPSIFPNGGESR